jgi:hypothetical protein
MIILLRDNAKFKGKINIFITDDNGARNNLVRDYGRSIRDVFTLKGLSVLSCIYHLKDEINKLKAIDYISDFPENKTKVISLKKKKKILLKNEKIIDKIFSNKIKINEFGDLILLDSEES